MSVSTLIRRWTLLAVLSCAAPAALADTVLITGANSGIGLEFARQYAADGWTVIATHRRATTPESLAELSARYENVRIETVDVTDPAMIAAVAEKLRQVPIDILINNAGVVGTFEDPRQHFGSLDYALLQQFIDINVAGPLRVSEAFYANVAASKQKKIVAISSRAGSLSGNSTDFRARNNMPLRYWYAISKAALNMGFIGLSKDAAADGISVAVYHPGLVRVARTERYRMSAEFQSFMVDVDDSVAALRQQFAQLDLAASGSFLNGRGKAIPW